MAWPSDLARTKNWGTEVLTDTDLEGQLDLIITYVLAMMHATTGHDHSGTANDGKLIPLTTGVTGVLPEVNGGTNQSTFTKGDIPYADDTNSLAKLAKGTDGQFIKQASDIPSWAFAFSQSKIITGTRVLNATNGDVAYTGVGFAPKTVIAIAEVTGDTAWSIGFGDSSLGEGSISMRGSGNNMTTGATFVYVEVATGQSQSGVLKTLDADGFTITWTLAGTNGSTANLVFLCLG